MPPIASTKTTAPGLAADLIQRQKRKIRVAELAAEINLESHAMVLKGHLLGRELSLESRREAERALVGQTIVSENKLMELTTGEALAREPASPHPPAVPQHGRTVQLLSS
jgi:hypothetical protein